MDTAAKQAGIFWQLKQLISLLAYAQKRTDRQFTADEQRLDAVYRNAYYYATEPFESKVSAADRPKCGTAHWVGHSCYGCISQKFPLSRELLKWKDAKKCASESLLT